MLQKILVPIIFLAAQLMVSWYGYFSGKIATKGTYLGWSYDSIFVRSLLLQFEYIWVLVLINLLFSLGFYFGTNSYKNFLVVAVLWMASGPIAAFLFNTFIVKNKIDPVVMAGVGLVIVGAILVSAHKEIMAMFP